MINAKSGAHTLIDDKIIAHKSPFIKDNVAAITKNK